VCHSLRGSAAFASPPGTSVPTSAMGTGGLASSDPRTARVANPSSGARASGPHAACGYSSTFQQSFGRSDDPHVSGESAASCSVRLRTGLPASRAHARSYGSPAATRRCLRPSVASIAVSGASGVDREPTCERCRRAAQPEVARSETFAPTSPKRDRNDGRCPRPNSADNGRSHHPIVGARAAGFERRATSRHANRR
jgi:hypothetical protein